MNYGYEPTQTGFKRSRQNTLAIALDELCARPEFVDAHGMSPYVENDLSGPTLYPGVRIRRITHLSEDQEEKLIQEADAIYVRIMGIDVTASA